MKKLVSLRKWLVFGAAGGLLLVMGMLLGTGILTMANDNVKTSVVAADDDDQASVLGTWQVTVDVGGNTLPALITYSQGGGLVVTDGGNRSDGETVSTGHGSWEHRGGNSFDFAFEEFNRQDGVLVFTARFEETIQVTGDTYQGEFELRQIFLDGSISDVIASGTTDAVRLEVGNGDDNNDDGD